MLMMNVYLVRHDDGKTTLERRLPRMLGCTNARSRRRSCRREAMAKQTRKLVPRIVLCRMSMNDKVAPFINHRCLPGGTGSSTVLRSLRGSRLMNHNPTNRPQSPQHQDNPAPPHYVDLKMGIPSSIKGVTCVSSQTSEFKVQTPHELLRMLSTS